MVSRKWLSNAGALILRQRVCFGLVLCVLKIIIIAICAMKNVAVPLCDACVYYIEDVCDEKTTKQGDTTQ